MVLAVMAVIAGVVAPSFFSLIGGSRLRAAARGVLAQCRYAREVAVSRSAYTRLVIDPEAGTSTVQIYAPPRSEGEPGGAEPMAGQPVPQGQADREWRDLTDGLGAARPLPERVRFDRLVTADQSGEPRVTFSPDGRGQDFFVSVTDRDDRVLAVHVRGTTGAPEVLSPADGDVFDDLDAQAESL